MTTDLITRARSGDDEAFAELIEPHRRELQVHCYRMLGSFQDAEDTLQETLLAAWQGLGRFEGRSSIRTWLYRIATNRCLNALRSATRRPAQKWQMPEIDPPEPTGLTEIVWLEPYPDTMLEGGIDATLGPEARYEQTEAISLAFVVALQILPARQRAALILSEVLGYRASEIADMLDSTTESVSSALKRARATLERRLPRTGERPPASDSPSEQALVERFVRAYESGDVDALVALLTEDIYVSMPPVPLEYHGRAIATRFFAAIFDRGRWKYTLTPSPRENGQPAFGAYVHTPAGIRNGASLLVLTLSASRISAITGFDTSMLPLFGLPPSLSE